MLWIRQKTRCAILYSNHKIRMFVGNLVQWDLVTDLWVSVAHFIDVCRWIISKRISSIFNYNTNRLTLFNNRMVYYCNMLCTWQIKNTWAWVWASVCCIYYPTECMRTITTLAIYIVLYEHRNMEYVNVLYIHADLADLFTLLHFHIWCVVTYMIQFVTVADVMRTWRHNDMMKSLVGIMWIVLVLISGKQTYYKLWYFYWISCNQ